MMLGNWRGRRYVPASHLLPRYCSPFWIFVILALIICAAFPVRSWSGLSLRRWSLCRPHCSAACLWVSMPPSIRPILGQVDCKGDIELASFPCSHHIHYGLCRYEGASIGLSARAGFLDEKGDLPQIERPMLADALSTTFAAIVGTTTSGAFIESATGVEAGGRTGFTSLVTAACFGLALFFSPFAAAIPPQAYGPALMVVGAFDAGARRQNSFQ